MKVSTERLENCQVNVRIELDAAEIDKRLRQTARALSRQFNVPGYRRGKAPYHAVIRVFGRETVQQQAIEDFGQELYESALDEIEYEPYQTGELQDVEWDPFVMTVLLPIPPEVDLGNYHAVRVPYEVEPVTDEQIEEYVAGLQQENAQWVPVDRPAALGDQVVVDMEGKAGDELIMSHDDYELILEATSPYPLPGFHEELVGMSPGEEKEFVLAVPEGDFDEAAAGQEASITVRLHTVKEEDLPPLDDELAMMVGDYDTLDDLMAGVRQQLETEALQKTEAEYLDKALDAFVEAAVKVEYPPQAVDRDVDFALNQMENNLAASGIQLDQYLAMIGKNREMYKQELRPAAEERVKKRLVLVQVAEQEELEIGDAEIESEIELMIEMAGEQSDAMREMLESPPGRQSIVDDLRISKAQERVVEIAKSEAPAPEVEEEEVELQAEVEAEVEVEAAAEAEAETKAETGTEEPALEGPAELEEQEAVEEPDSGEAA